MNFLFYKRCFASGVVLLILVMFGGCTLERSFTSWPGAFFIDSVTIGAFREEWSETQTGIIWKSFEQSSPQISFYKYSIPSKSLTLAKSRIVDISGPEYESRVFFANPWAFYNCVIGSDAVSAFNEAVCAFNIVTGENVVIRQGNEKIGNPIPIGISKTGKYVYYSLTDGRCVAFSLMARQELKSFRGNLGIDSVIFYVDEPSDQIFFEDRNMHADRSLYTSSIVRYDLLSSEFSAVGTWSMIGVKRAINYGDALLAYTRYGMAYLPTAHILDSAPVFTQLPYNYSQENVDMDLTTGNCVYGSGSIHLGNILGDPVGEVIISSEVKEE